MKTVIAGLEEGLNAIAEALEGGGGSSGLPEITGDADGGKVVTAHWSTLSGEGSYQLDPVRQVPDTTGVTNGYVLTNSNGTPAWAAASGGGGNGYQIYVTSGDVYEDSKSGGFYATLGTPVGKGGATGNIYADYIVISARGSGGEAITVNFIAGYDTVTFDSDPGVNAIELVIGQ